MNKLIKSILWFLPKKITHFILYYKNTKSFLSYKKPQRYDEKLRWLVVNQYDCSFSKYADKYKVREYVKECGLGEILVPIYGVWDKIEDIDFNVLPEKFVLKANHGSGEQYYSIIENKDRINLDKELDKLRETLKSNFAKVSYEYHYKYIEPKIIAEKYIEDNNKKRLSDYKVLCFNGVPKYILVCSERDCGRDYFDTKWNYVNFAKEEYRYKYKINKPKNLEKMIEYASVLAKPFCFARIDFYNLDGKIYFGEITLTPSACFHSNITEDAQYQIGDQIRLPMEEKYVK